MGVCNQGNLTNRSGHIDFATRSGGVSSRRSRSHSGVGPPDPPCGVSVACDSAAFAAKSCPVSPSQPRPLVTTFPHRNKLFQDGNRHTSSGSNAPFSVTRACAGLDDGFTARLKNAVPGLFTLMRRLGTEPTSNGYECLVACCKRKDGKGIRFITRELMRPYFAVSNWPGMLYKIENEV